MNATWTLRDVPAEFKAIVGPCAAVALGMQVIFILFNFIFQFTKLIELFLFFYPGTCGQLVMPILLVG